VVKTLAPDIFVRSGDEVFDNLIANDYILSLGCKVETVPYLNGYSSISLSKNILKI